MQDLWVRLRRGDREMISVPGKAGVAWKSLRSPSFICVYLLPMRIVETWRGPTRIVADVKFPAAAESDDVLA